jgi:hypothetical protein
MDTRGHPADRPAVVSPDRPAALVDEIAAVDGPAGPDGDAGWAQALGVLVEDLLHLPPEQPPPDPGAKILKFRPRTHAS